MGKVMLTIRLEPAAANLAEVRRRLGLSEAEIDPAFGVVLVSPADQLYAVLVDARAAARVQGLPGVADPFANPKIEPYGPPTN